MYHNQLHVAEYFWEADSCSASQWIITLLCDPKVRYPLHIIPPLDPITLRLILILFCLYLPSDYFPLGFPTKILYAWNDPPRKRKTWKK
jgi:hypothetical protein